jgi:hypothetical protein
VAEAPVSKMVSLVVIGGPSAPWVVWEVMVTANLLHSVDIFGLKLGLSKWKREGGDILRRREERRGEVAFIFSLCYNFQEFINHSFSSGGGLLKLSAFMKIPSQVWCLFSTYSLEIVLHLSELGHNIDRIGLSSCFLDLRVLRRISCQ